MKSEVEGIDD